MIFSAQDRVGGLPVLVSERQGGGTLRTYQYVSGVPLRTAHGAGTAGYYLSDDVGSVTNIARPSGAVGATYRYSPYGTLRSENTSAAYASNSMKFTGQQQDPTGSYNLRARQYVPSFGSFTQTDPMAYGAGSAFESAYAYGRNNPMQFTDPLGLRSAEVGGSKPLFAEPKRLTFSITPSGRDWGLVDVRAFISTARSGTGPAASAGDDRSFSAGATCAESRACFRIDFINGVVSAEINTSCNPSKSKCVSASSKNSMSVSGSADSLRIGFDLVNPKAPGGVPSIDGTWRFSRSSGPCFTTPGKSCEGIGQLKVEFNGDAYPSWEVYHTDQLTAGSQPWQVMALRESGTIGGVPTGLLPQQNNKKASEVVPLRHG
jgi:RHS repeat-associated protein